MLKRAFDVVAAGALLLLLAPLLAVCGLLIRLLDGTPVLYRHERVGQRGRPFFVLKLRTMRAGRGPYITAAADPRITQLGRVLRRLKIDELPQLWNVLRGEMSLVGPRPEVPEYVRVHARAFRAVLHLRPGITDWASLIFSDEERLLPAGFGADDFYQRALLPRKVALARLYARRRSLGLDMRLIAATACVAVGLPRVGRAVAGRRLAERARAKLARSAH